MKFTPFHGVLLATLYFSQGLPSGFMAHALPALMAEQGVPVEYIGFLKLLALPWFFKFLWAPAIDGNAIATLGQHRGWILCLQGAVIVLLLSLSFFSQDYLFGGGIFLFLAILLLINLAASTQDIATDGLAVRLLPERLRGLGNSLQVSGYKLGMILSGNLLLMALAAFGWSFTFQLLALILFVVTVPAIIFREPQWQHDSVGADLRVCPGAHMGAHLQKTSGYWKDNYSAFMSRPGMGLWLTVLLTYKIADSLGSAMIKPLLVHSGYTLEQIAQISLSAMIAGLAAAFVAGGIYYRVGWRASLILFGLLQALGIGAYGLIALDLVSAQQVYVIAIFEQMADGMSTVALFALMMRYCRENHEGGDFTLQVSLHMVIAGTLGMWSGFLVKFLGYDIHFAIALCAGLLALVPVMLLINNDKKKNVP